MEFKKIDAPFEYEVGDRLNFDSDRHYSAKIVLASCMWRMRVAAGKVLVIASPAYREGNDHFNTWHKKIARTNGYKKVATGYSDGRNAVTVWTK